MPFHPWKGGYSGPKVRRIAILRTLERIGEPKWGAVEKKVGQSSESNRKSELWTVIPVRQGLLATRF